MPRKRRIFARILFLLYLVAICILCFGKFSGSSDFPTSLLGIPSDKIVHFLMFLPFPILAFFAFDKYTESTGKSLLYAALTCLAGCLLAAGTELIQSRLSYRSGDPNDFLSDMAAIALGSILVFFLDIRKQKKQ